MRSVPRPQMRSFDKILDIVEDERARHYESSKETEPAEDGVKCSVCASNDIDYSGGKYFCNECGEFFFKGGRK